MDNQTLVWGLETRAIYVSFQWQLLRQKSDWLPLCVELVPLGLLRSRGDLPRHPWKSGYNFQTRLPIVRRYSQSLYNSSTTATKCLIPSGWHWSFVANQGELPHACSWPFPRLVIVRKRLKARCHWKNNLIGKENRIFGLAICVHGFFHVNSLDKEPSGAMKSGCELRECMASYRMDETWAREQQYLGSRTGCTYYKLKLILFGHIQVDALDYSTIDSSHETSLDSGIGWVSMYYFMVPTTKRSPTQGTHIYRSKYSCIHRQKRKWANLGHT